MADMELLLVYAWWCSLCVQEKGEVFATESTEGHGKMKRKGLFCHEIHEKTRKEKIKSFFSFRSKSLFVFFRGFRGFRGKKSVSLFFPCSSVDSVARKRNPPARLYKREGAVSIPGRSSDSGA